MRSKSFCLIALLRRRSCACVPGLLYAQIKRGWEVDFVSRPSPSQCTTLFFTPPPLSVKSNQTQSRGKFLSRAARQCSDKNFARPPNRLKVEFLFHGISFVAPTKTHQVVICENLRFVWTVNCGVSFGIDSNECLFYYQFFGFRPGNGVT